MNWVSYEQMVQDCWEWARQLPRFDMVVGIPRSGMLVASILSLYWNVPLASVKDYQKGETMGAGNRLSIGAVRKVLVVDDSIFRGKSIEKTKKMLEDKKEEISYGALYSAGKVNPDYYFKVVPQDRVFQWNLLAHKEVIGNSCWDIDGCLCVKPTSEQNDDGERYRRFLLDTAPLYVPDHPIGAIVTSRLEKFRLETEEWLAKHNIKYGSLIMLNYPSGEVRRRMGHHAYHKSEVFKSSNSKLFIEDEPWQAEQIARNSGKACLCVTNWRLYK